MPVTRNDVIIPSIFTPYVIEQSTLRDAFLASGVVRPMAELNAEEGGDFVNVPHWEANLSGTFETLTDSTSLTPNKIQAEEQRAVIVHRGNAWEARDLAKLAAGSDPMAAIGIKVADYINHEKQKDLFACLGGIFGPTGSDNAGASFADLTVDGGGSGETILSPRQVIRARALLGDQGDKLTAVSMHSSVYYDLMERKAIDFVYDGTGAADSDASQGSTANAFGNVGVPYYMDMRVIVSDDVQASGSLGNRKFATYFFKEGAVGSGNQLGLQTETDRDILAKSSAMSIDLHYCYHPIGAKWGANVVNPDPTQLANINNWLKVYDTKNIGIVRATVTSNFG